MSGTGVEIAGMVPLRGGTFEMGSNHHYPEEAPAFTTSVRPFAMDAGTVTNAEFAAFIRATGYVTEAERPLDPALTPDLPPEAYVPGGLVFTQTEGPVPLHDFRQWWRFVPGAYWAAPEGPETDLDGRWNHPVVQVSLADAMAYAQWAGKALPTEKEWEFAARSGVDTTWPWGDELRPEGRVIANTWQGEFPFLNNQDGGVLSWPSRAGAANAYGLYTMIGNVWEWTVSRFGTHGETRACCSPSNRVSAGETYVVKGGSFLCAPSYCRRYRATARSPQEARSATNHLGFRCVLRTAGAA